VPPSQSPPVGRGTSHPSPYHTTTIHSQPVAHRNLSVFNCENVPPIPQPLTFDAPPELCRWGDSRGVAHMADQDRAPLSRPPLTKSRAWSWLREGDELSLKSLTFSPSFVWKWTKSFQLLGASPLTLHRELCPWTTLPFPDPRYRLAMVRRPPYGKCWITLLARDIKALSGHKGIFCGAMIDCVNVRHACST